VWWTDLSFWWQQRQGVVYSMDAPQSSRAARVHISPISTDFGLVIEKLGINETVAANVDPFKSAEYLPQLQKYGVAHAKNTVPPGEAGITYLFGHSTINVWDIGRYHAPFTLLEKLEMNDRIVLFYKGKRYDYFVTEMKVVSPVEVSYLTQKRDMPTLILQTCDPPGQNTHRLLVIAEMK
jgi:LPXTG-site transpeptidase (sortase) family protein